MWRAVGALGDGIGPMRHAGQEAKVVDPRLSATACAGLAPPSASRASTAFTGVRASTGPLRADGPERTRRQPIAAAYARARERAGFQKRLATRTSLRWAGLQTRAARAAGPVGRAHWGPSCVGRGKIFSTCFTDIAHWLQATPHAHTACTHTACMPLHGRFAWHAVQKVAPGGHPHLPGLYGCPAPCPSPAPRPCAIST
jgi:hypothetical protein